ncbi:hypothetical protein CPB86DRAFT_793532 [Serendipita vermifera]|nr:hypothetical protein CPB86DRAFT_793532 [Serendipita vermifera]
MIPSTHCDNLFQPVGLDGPGQNFPDCPSFVDRVPSGCVEATRNYIPANIGFPLESLGQYPQPQAPVLLNPFAATPASPTHPGYTPSGFVGDVASLPALADNGTWEEDLNSLFGNHQLQHLDIPLPVKEPRYPSGGPSLPGYSRSIGPEMTIVDTPARGETLNTPSLAWDSPLSDLESLYSDPAPYASTMNFQDTTGNPRPARFECLESFETSFRTSGEANGNLPDLRSTTFETEYSKT